MSASTHRAIVFAYHNVGVRGLLTLLANAVDVPLVVTHEDDAEENIWFGSVAEYAAYNDIPVITPADPNTPQVIERIRSCEPVWFFSFYYRHMLGEEALSLPTQGAYNVHGSLLPKYRGRAPVNWAVLHGERQTGASLHRMEIKPDAGPLVDQQSVPILPNDTAHDVFQKVTVAAEQVLARSIPMLLDGTAQEKPMDLADGSYFGGRRPEDGRVDWNASSVEIHNLIRAVAPPYPGAFCDLGSIQLRLLGSYNRGERAVGKAVRIYWDDGRCWLDCADGKRIRLTRLEIGDVVLDKTSFRRFFGGTEMLLS